MNRLITFVLLMSLGGWADTAKAPPPASMRWRITCVVDEKAEWKTEGQSANDPFSAISQMQTRNSIPTLIINTNHKSMLEMDNNGTFHSGNFPIDIIISVTSRPHAKSQKDSRITTITACWKI